MFSVDYTSFSLGYLSELVCYDLIITANFHLSTLFFKKIIIFAIYF